MPQLKNRNDGIPGDFQIIHPEAGMKKPFRYPSFSGVKNFEMKFRKGNPAICAKMGWTTDPDEVDYYVEQQQVQRLLAAGQTSFLIMTEDVPKSNGQHVLPAALAVAAGHLGKLAAGRSLIVQWLGDKLEPVPVELANQRAKICSTCPMNQEGDIWQRLTAIAGRQLKGLIELKQRMKLKTDYDKELKVCVACDCVLSLKCFSPIENIREHLLPEVKAELAKAPNCWVLSEQ
jgi:hypothetical protein